MQNFKRAWRLFFYACLGACLFLSSPAWAWSSQGRAVSQDKPLTKKQAHALAHRVAHGMMARLFFLEEELSRRVALALIPIHVANAEITDKEFTNEILNSFEDYPKITLVNLDPIIGETLHYQLVSYDNEWLTRKRGLLMGAEFVITGSLEEVLQTDPNGPVRKIYELKLQVREIRTNNVVLEQKETLNAVNTLKKRR